MELPWGEPEKPFSDGVLSGKFVGNAERARSQAQGELIQQEVFGLEETSVKRLMRCLL
jgi:hypothetical protein